ncbi:midnolin [Platysternon megacephalum]|uniref:Midnolin n=1 Tax=Platysternon megacephalum TaxID=55544 RepID=A0A4D9EAN6_9SAUR|nr:midnolin [Platysternon megacephalum]
MTGLAVSCLNKQPAVPRGLYIVVVVTLDVSQELLFVKCNGPERQRRTLKHAPVTPPVILQKDQLIRAIGKRRTSFLTIREIFAIGKGGKEQLILKELDFILKQ